MTAPEQLGDLSTKPTLTGELVTLRPFRAEDIGAMIAVLSDPEVVRLTGSAGTTGAAATEAAEAAADSRLTEWYSTRDQQSDRIDLAVADRDGRCVGEVVLNDVDADNLSCNFRILLGSAGRDRGLGSEATRLIVDYAFEVLGFHRISLTVFRFNPRARRAYEKAGFRSEGVMRESFRFDGQWYDDEMMAVLRSEWLAARHAGSESVGS